MLRSPPSSLSLVDGDVSQLGVLHVGDEFIGAAGYAIGPRMVVSSSHQFRNRIPVAAVEGAPMLVGNLRKRRQLDRNKMTGPEDWVVLAASVDRFTPNLIDPAARPAVGQRVVLGGFLLFDKGYTRKEYWRTRPTVIEGRVIDPVSRLDEQTGLVLVKVPQGRYDGFSGGPAACLDQGGELRVWGTIVYQGYADMGKSWNYVLGIAPLPDDFPQQPIWTSY